MLWCWVILKVNGTAQAPLGSNSGDGQASHHPSRHVDIGMVNNGTEDGQHGLTSRPFSCCWALVSYMDGMQHL